MATPTLARPQPAPGRLRSTRFDSAFVVGIPMVALASASLVIVRPDLWNIVLAADIWLLGYHHVISTYTRMGLGGNGETDHRRLFRLLPVTALIVGLVGYAFGMWVLATTYLYWQWWHYSRQSWGVSRVYQRAAGTPPSGTEIEPHRLTMAAFYLLPLWGIMSRSAQVSDSFLGANVRFIPMASSLVTVAGVLAAAAIGAQVYFRMQAFRRGELPKAQTAYLVSHYAMFAIGYVLIDSIDHGWLAINIWHNAQYIAFVWLFNNKRFEGVGAQAAGALDPAGDEATPRLSLLARLSQRSNVAWYFLACIAGSTIVYLLLRSTVAAVVAPMVVYQTINFHHYVVDSVIWKVRSKPIQETLGITG